MFLLSEEQVSLLTNGISKGFFFLIVTNFFFLATVSSRLLIMHLILHSVMPGGRHLTLKISKRNCLRLHDCRFVVSQLQRLQKGPTLVLFPGEIPHEACLVPKFCFLVKINTRNAYHGLEQFFHSGCLCIILQANKKKREKEGLRL